MKKTLLILAASILALSACSKPDKNAEQPASAQNTAHNENTQLTASAPAGDTAETSLDWAGEYTGIFPCADCEGIETELELKPDYSYELSEEYLGKGQKNEHKTKGKFSFDAQNSSVITLDSNADGRKFFIGENFAEARDRETGKALDTKLNYKLLKEHK